ncbi:nuclease harbi1 [Plakobranchus ocellatus]|uniref:Nuclease harbi1 n=1 Tax=Plakobranchus ocellatus TaxID=259542 RepID=A0AAV3Z9M6_9GAST|nr:nuclease harbi1 [Plakobranchus ocellatus]
MENVAFMEMGSSMGIFFNAAVEDDLSSSAMQFIFMLQFMSKTLTESPTRISRYVEDTVPMYGDLDFKSHFRVTRVTLEDICCRLTPHLVWRKHPHHKQILSFLWFMGNTETFRSVADRFGISKGSLHMIISRVSRALMEIAPEIIKFPQNTEDCKTLCKGFEKFPKTIGCVDGTYIPMAGKSQEKRSAYVCRHGYCAMHVQVTCESNLKIIDISTGYPGSVHDARVFRNSQICEKMETFQEFHLLGDSAYPLKMGIMTPYKDYGCLTNMEKKYNYIHSSLRNCVERCIGLLKGKWRRLKNFDCQDDILMCRCIVACAVLHNLIIDLEAVNDNDMEPDETFLGAEDDLDTDANVADENAIRKRDRFCFELCGM